jgi:hypothetical protein
MCRHVAFTPEPLKENLCKPKADRRLKAGITRSIRSLTFKYPCGRCDNKQPGVGCKCRQQDAYLWDTLLRNVGSLTGKWHFPTLHRVE